MDISLGRLMGTWAADGTAYYTTMTETFDGVPLEVYGVVTSAGENLTGNRVESVADCQALVSSFYFSPGATSTLYIHLLNNVDPNTLSVRCDFVRRYGSVGSMEPLLGPEKSTNPGLETWTTATDLASFTEIGVGASGVVISQIPGTEGSLGARVAPDPSALASATFGGAEERSQTLVSGAHYAVEFAYRTSPQLDPGLTPRVRARAETAVATYITSDGRTTTTDATGHALAHTGGEWRRALFVFRAPKASTTGGIAFGIYNGSGGAISGGYVDFDDWHIRRIYRYEYVEPRLAPDSVPTVEMSAETPFFGSQTVGLGTLRLLNSDGGAETMSAGYFETLLSGYDVVGHPVQLYHGVTFDDGRETWFGDCWKGFNGTVQAFEVDELAATFSLQNVRALMASVIPPRNYDLGTFPNMTTSDVGRPRPVLFGTKANIRPTRIDYGATTFLPVYEVVDPTDKAGAVMTTGHVYVYLDQDSADRQDSTRRIDVSSSLWSEDTATGRITITGHPGPFRVVGGSSAGPADQNIEGMNDAIDVSADGSPLSVFLTPGLYTADGLATELDTRLGIGFTVTYSNTTHAFTITYSGISLSLLIGTGTNKQRSAFPMLGFDGTADRTGSLSYASSTAVYGLTRVDQFVVRVDATGMKDDAGGSYTGTASALIEKGPDIYRFLLLKYVKQPSSLIDASFITARSTATQKLGIYAGQQMTLQEMADRIEFSCFADLVMDGQGKHYWRDRQASAAAVATAAANAPVLYDRDFIEFSAGKSPEDTYPIVRLAYDEDPATAKPRTFEVSNPYVELRHGRAQPVTFATWLTDIADVRQQAWNNMLTAVLPRRKLAFTVKGRLMRKILTDLVKVQRTRMLTAEFAGMDNSDVFRIRSLAIDPQTHTMRVLAYTADLPRIGTGAEGGLAAQFGGDQWQAVPWRGPRVAGTASPFKPGRIGP